MPEARDRLSRPVDVAAMFARRRSAAVQVLVDDTENGADLFRSPIRQQPAAMATGVRTPMERRGGGGVGIGRGGLGTPRTGNSRFRSSFRSSSAAAVASRENTPAPGIVRRGRGRGRSGVLPYWYPRTPLRDITAIARAIERTRARLREDEGQDVASPAPQEQGFLDPSVSVSVAPLEHNIITTSLHSAFRRKPCPPSVGKVPKILLGIANQTTAGSECLTPQKKLLNSIDTVEKVVMEELQKLKRTPTAKRAEREKRVKTLMSMR
ncbi:LOW QUALITY PROTEIN: protein POLYCHOME [Morus notabilis]|uniref:LOW QUALITY PROTEIN: protein POLYCHOME n=1 Tax=Morus notabilis TaxID=981085 RepID=UPI000CED79BA|nr:LOW QUALITY PROTEIN: protein POLYCHOME [Morus notabilis]